MPVLVEELSCTNESVSTYNSQMTNNVNIEPLTDTPSKTNVEEEKSKPKPIYTGPRWDGFFVWCKVINMIYLLN
jgi:hypothetical protein